MMLFAAGVVVGIVLTLIASLITVVCFIYRVVLEDGEAEEGERVPFALLDGGRKK